MEFKDLIITALLVGLFIFAVISFGVQLSKNNNANMSILNNPSINKSFVSITSELEEAEDTAESGRVGLWSGIPILEEVGIVLDSIVSVGQVFSGMVIGVFGITFELITTTLGIPPIVLGVITAIILISIVLLAWSVFKAGK